MKAGYFADQSKAGLTEVISWRRGLHQVPELGFDLPQTAAFITGKLDNLNISYRMMAQTGITVVIEGENPGPVIALRADMDALPIKEETGLSFASLNKNMHACGHDAHCAMLLGAAKIINAHRSALCGAVKLIFQPAEEGAGGAQAMIAAGCLENPDVDAIYGLHVGQIMPEVGLGQVGVKAGTIMAAVTTFSVTVTGKGTHGAYPHEGVDALMVAVQIISALQQLISREVSPTEPAVLTVGQITGGEASNIVAQKVVFTGDFRTVSDKSRRFIEGRLKEICTLTAQAARATAQVEILSCYPPTVNHPAMAGKVARVAGEILGEHNVIEISKPSMGAEDMSFYLEKVGGAYFMLGTSNPEKGIIYPHHNPKFDLDEDVLWVGPALFAALVFDNQL